MHATRPATIVTSLRSFAFAFLLVLVLSDPHQVDSLTSTKSEGRELIQNTTAISPGTGGGCSGLAPSSILRSVQDVPAAAQDVVSAAVPLYNSNEHGAAACVYESLLWKLIRSSWLSPEDPLFVLASHTLSVSRTLASTPGSVWPVDPSSGVVGTISIPGNSNVTAGSGAGRNASTGFDTGASFGTSVTEAANAAQAPQVLGSTNASGESPLTSSVASVQVANKPGSSNTTAARNGTVGHDVADGEEPQADPSDFGSGSGNQTEAADQTRSWTVRWAMEALVGWGNVVGACNAMASSAHSQQVLQIAGYLRLKYPEQCGLSLLIGAEQLRIVCGAALTVVNAPGTSENATNSSIARGPKAGVPGPPTASGSAQDPTAVDNIRAMNARLSSVIARTPSQALEQRIYVLADAIASVSNVTIPDSGASQRTLPNRTPPSFLSPNASAQGCNPQKGCVDTSSASVTQTLLFSLGGLMALLVLGLCSCVLWQRARVGRRARAAAQGNGLTIVPVEGPAPDTLEDSEPTGSLELKSPLVRALRAIAVWLPNGLAAVAFEERKARDDLESGSRAATPRTPKDA